MVFHTLYLGHSYARRLDQFMQVNNFDNFGLELGMDSVQVWYQGGQRIDRLHVSSAFSCVQQFLPSLVVLDFGTNDLDSATADPQRLAHQLVSLVADWSQHSTISCALFCPVLPRGPGRFAARSPAFEPNRILFNQTLLHICQHQHLHSNFHVLQHSRMLNILPLLVDGVHLNQAGLKKYYFSLRRAIIRAKKRL